MSYASMRVAVRFADLLQGLEPSASVIGRARVRASAIATRLGESFRVAKSEIVGSHVKGTAIHGWSDLDVFVVLARESVKRGDSLINSETLLNRVRDELRYRYPQSTIGRDRMAVSVKMDAGASSIDVVPAVFKGPHPTAGVCFQIPDGEGGWITTAPDRHLTYFRQADARSGGKLRRAVQLLKHWKFARSQYVHASSFHVELVLAEGEVAVGPVSYSRALADALAVLRERGGAAIRDPLGVAGLVPAVYTEAQRQQLCTALDYASYNADLALQAEEDGEVSESVYRWRQVFNDRFPA